MATSVLFALLAFPLGGQTLPKCPDNGESSSKRHIHAGYGAPVAEVPQRLATVAVSAYLSFMFGNQQPSDAASRVSVNSARKYDFGKAVFYTLTIGNVQTIASTACPRARCTRDFWPGDALIVADRDRPPSGVPGDEFFVMTRETPQGHASLVTSDPTGDHYELVETCTVDISDSNRMLLIKQLALAAPKQATPEQPDVTFSASALTRSAPRPSAPPCAPDDYTLCLLDRFHITVEDLLAAVTSGPPWERAPRRRGRSRSPIPRIGMCS